MEKPYWEHNIATGQHMFVLADNVRLTVQQVRDSLTAMQGINSPNPLYEVLVRAATDYMSTHNARTRAEQAQRQQSYASAEEILRRAAESMQSDIYKRAFGGAYSSFDFGANARYREQRTAPPPPRPGQPRHWKEVLGFPIGAHVAKHEAKGAYRRKALDVHQKHGGDDGAMHEEMVALNVAKRQFEAELGK